MDITDIFMKFVIVISLLCFGFVGGCTWCSMFKDDEE